jgi:hypothetical protein
MDEFEIVLQINQRAQNGRVLNTYGPEPITLLETDDPDEAIEVIDDIFWSIGEYHGFNNPS